MFLGIMLISIGGGLTATGALAPIGIPMIIGGILRIKSVLGGGTKKAAAAPAPKAASAPKAAQHMPSAPKVEGFEPQTFKSAKATVSAPSAKAEAPERPTVSVPPANREAPAKKPVQEKPAQQAKAEKRCSFCGAVVREGDLFCGECGSIV